MLNVKFAKIPDLPDIQDYDFSRKYIICGSLEERNAEHIELLQNILRAVKIDMMTEVQVLWLPTGEDWTLSNLLKETQRHWIISFGLMPFRLGFNLEPKFNQAFSLVNMSFLFTSTFTQLKQNQAAKKQLWDALKANFIHE